MNRVIEVYREVIVQIATPYTTGTGFYLSQFNLVVTNEHVVRDNRWVVIKGAHFDKQQSRVLFLDERHDLAFLEPPERLQAPAALLYDDESLMEGLPVMAIGHPFGFEFTTTMGIISNTGFNAGNDVQFLIHDAALNPGNSGGPLVDRQGRILGVNTFVKEDGENTGFSLPVRYLLDNLKEYQEHYGRIGARCSSCQNIVLSRSGARDYCPHCGTSIILPDQIPEYEPIGMTKTVEDMLDELGFPVGLTRRGPRNWELTQGSARINISYYEKAGLIMGDAYLCLLPRENIEALYEYLLRQNFALEGLTFSVKGQDIILSLLIYDRYLNLDTGLKLLRHLFERADYYDNILVEEYGAHWKYADQQ